MTRTRGSMFAAAAAAALLMTASAAAAAPPAGASLTPGGPGGTAGLRDDNQVLSLGSSSVITRTGEFTAEGGGRNATERSESCPVPSECGVHPKTQCPVAGPLQVSPPEHCVPLYATLHIVVTPEAGGGCVQNDYLQVALENGLAKGYEAVWYWDLNGDNGTRWWASPGTTWPHSVQGEGGVSYKVPKGYAAWSAGGGAGSTCSGKPTPGTLGYAGFGAAPKSRSSVSGTVVYHESSHGTKGAPNISVQVSCRGGGTAMTHADGSYEVLVDTGTRCTVKPRLRHGEVSTPRDRVFRVDSDVRHVDFDVPCGAVPGAKCT